MKPSILKKVNISKLLPKTGKPATSPGTVEYIGKRRDTSVKFHIMNYNETDFVEKTLGSVEECFDLLIESTITWINITGVHEEKTIQQVGKKLDIHPLVLEDIANTTQRPKFEEYDNYLFTIIKMNYNTPDSKEIISEQLSLIVGKNYVVSFQENEIDVLDGLRERLRSDKGRVRKSGSDYLMYAIIDAVTDNYFSVLEFIGEEIESMEADLLKYPSQEILNRIYGLKQELVFLRKSIWPMREVINNLQRSEHSLIENSMTLYLRDVYDHTIQVVETVETFRDMSSGMLDLYLSTVSNKMNEVMKVLTIFASIFIPLTFLAGVYGMNFRFIPELNWRWAYPVWWAVSIAVAISMIAYFRRKKWL